MKRLERLAAALAAEPGLPTTVADPVRDHIADSLSALPVVGTPSALVDIGSGLGFPGLALAAALPSCHVTLVESRSRAASASARLRDAAGLRNVDVVNERVELVSLREVSVVTARALAPLAVLVEYAAPLLAMGGRLVAWKGARDADEERAGEEAAGIVGLSLDAVHRVEPFPEAHSRHLHVYLKTAPTPDRFPRRPGMARKRPLAR